MKSNKSFIDIVEGKLKVELTDDISKAIKYRTEFRAKDDSQYVNSAIRNKKSDSLQQQIGEKHFSFRLLSDSEVSI